MKLLDNVLFMALCAARLFIGRKKMPILLCLYESGK